MSGYFDPSPRASKRRKITTYKADRTILDKTDAVESEELGKSIAIDDTIDSTGGFPDSAYGSKEESLIEDESLKHTNTDTMDSDNTTSKPEHGRRTNRTKESTPPVDLIQSDNENYREGITIQPRSSGRERKKPRRYSISAEKPKTRKVELGGKAKLPESKSGIEKKVKAKSSGTPRGILTPSRKEKQTGPRKSVVFGNDEKEIEKHLGFKDINDSTKKRPLGSTTNEQRDPSHMTESSLIPRPTIDQPEVTLLAEGEVQEFDDDAILTNQYIQGSLPPIEATSHVADLSSVAVDDDPAILNVRATILAQIARQKPVKLPIHLQNQYEALHSLLKATVVSGESNSLLLLGARGSGKSCLLETAIHELSTKYSNNFHSVRLNGFYQTDDKVALREIWRQLGREMKVDEMETGELGGSYADTMSSLLSLLSHPDDFSDPAGHGSDAMEIDSGAVRTSKSVIFILNEFDLFTTHPRQTLLYNLFDIAQSKKAPIAVIGCSTRMDVVDCLEKRVKSRFSHRWIHIPPPPTLNDFASIVENNLCIENVGSIGTTKLSERDLEARERWNRYMQSTFLTQDKIRELITRVYYTSKSMSELLTAMYMSIATAQLPRSNSQDEVFGPSFQAISCVQKPEFVSLLSTLPTLHLCLLIAASRLDTIHNLTAINFNLVYAHYVELISRSKLQVTASGAVAIGASLRQWNRESAMSAWEDLGLYESLGPATGAMVGAGSRDGSSAGSVSIGGEGASIRMWRVDTTLEELSWAVKEKWTESGGVRNILLSWCKEI